MFYKNTNHFNYEASRKYLLIIWNLEWQVKNLEEKGLVNGKMIHIRSGVYIFLLVPGNLLEEAL